MASLTYDNLNLTPSWQDAIATHAGLANTDVLVQNMGSDGINVAAGGTSAPSVSKTGIFLDRFDSVVLNTDHIWLRCSFSGSVSLTAL